MKIVTAGSAYIDIDAYAASIAEAARLNLNGEEAIAASSAPLNESTTKSLRELPIGLSPYTPGNADQFILVDVSKESYFDPIVLNGKVIEVIDHHPGQEKYWATKKDVKTDIELIGSACTQIFERWQRDDKLADMKPEIAQLLAAGILDNTLNFEATVTTDRDHKAYDTLRQIGHLPEDFAAQYFTECQQAIDQNFESALLNDTKTMDEAPLLPHTLGQIVVWNGKAYVEEKMEAIKATLSKLSEDWALNLISIEEGRNYLVTDSNTAEQKLTKLLGIEFKDNIAVTDRLWLRKELLGLALK